MRVLSAILLVLGALGCATSASDENVTAKVESFGGYVVHGVLLRLAHPADRIPCKLDARLGTHFFLSAPSGEKGRVSLVTTWTSIQLGAPESARPKQLGREVRRLEYPSTGGTGTYLVLTLNEESDLFPAHYEQTVATGSGRVLFKHQFTVPECQPAA
jgi:hypothetical protein